MLAVRAQFLAGARVDGLPELVVHEVAADQLDQSQSIAAQFVPQKIVEDATEEVPEFVEPKCPKCGSDDVVLEGVDPENTWRCEQCDEQWTESAPAIAGEGPKG